MLKAKEGKLTVQRSTLTLAAFSERFFGWVESTRLEAKTKSYYKSGWKTLAKTPISGVRLRHITTDEAEALRFPFSAANANCALRTLRRMLTKAADWKLIAAAPRIKLVKEEGRSVNVDSELGLKLLAAAKQPLRDVLIIMLDSGMRPSEVFALRWEDVFWDRGVVFIPRGKTKKSRRFLPMSNRVRAALQLRRGELKEGWVFPANSKCGHTVSVSKEFARARIAVGLPKEVVLYCARHTFATNVMGATGDLTLVMGALGHANPQTAMLYQHPNLEKIRTVINGPSKPRRQRHNLRHKAGKGGEDFAVSV